MAKPIRSRSLGYSGQAMGSVFPAIAKLIDGANQDADRFFFTAVERCRVIAVQEVHAVAEATAGVAQVMIEKHTGTSAVASGGTDLLTGGISLKAAANVVQSGTLVSDVDSLTLEVDQSLAADITSAMTELDGAVVIVWLMPIPPQVHSVEEA